MKKIWLLNTLGSGTDFINIISSSVQVEGVIGLSKREANDNISDYTYQKDFCQARNIKFIEVKSYNLKDSIDKDLLLSLEIDVLVICGWQRLIPEWLIDHCRICAIGSHGSPFGITGGRGRSPQNWSLILGLEKFYISIFKIGSGIDDGDVISTKEFRFSNFDDIQSSYFKVVLLTSQMLIDAITNNKLNSTEHEKQNDNHAEYFPQRIPEDGYIDWNFSTQDIHRFVRALTTPYPGAKTRINNHEVTIWEAIPFEFENIYFPCSPGQILIIFNNGQLLVKTGDGYLLVKKFTSDIINLKKNMKFASIDGKEQLKAIIQRHENIFPEFKVVSALKEYAKMKN